jgi:methyl acetate hydrolase
MNQSAIDRVLQEAVSSGAVPGVVAVVGDREGVRYEGAFGRLAVGGAGLVLPDTMMRLASMTKPIVCVAALQLIEQGQIAPEQPVGDILPAFDRLPVLEGFDGERPRLRAPVRRATIGNLLTHTSGLGYWFVNADILRYQRLTGIPDSSGGLLAAFETPLIADPGTRWEYGTSIDWLGLIVEEVSGKDLSAYCAERIFAPLGMSDATFHPSEEQRSRMMALHARQPDGSLAISQMAFRQRPEFSSGGSGAYATAGDYLRFLRALLGGGELDGERILRSETVESIFTDQLDGIPWPSAIPSALPELSNSVPSVPFGHGFGRGLHLVLRDLPRMRRAGTGDGSGLFNCYYWIDRASGIAGALFTQVLPFFDERIVERLVSFEIAVYAGISAPPS